MSALRKEKFKTMAKADKVHYEREMKTYIPPEGETEKKLKDPFVPQRPPSASCSVENYPKIKEEPPGLSVGDRNHKQTRKNVD